MRTTHAVSSSIALAILLASGAAAATVSSPPPSNCAIIKRDVRGDIKDTFVWDKYPGVNHGTYVETSTGLSSSGGEKRALYGFDLSSVPFKATVTTAKLWLLSNSNYAGTVNAYRLLDPWTETGATWNNYGAKDPTVLASFLSGGWSKWVHLDLTGVVQSWVSGEVPNHGIVLEEGILTGTTYKSSETTTTANRPYLEICYSDPVSSIGDTVWFDANADGIQDAGEQGIANVVLDLYVDTDCDGLGDGASISAAVTNGSGIYTFSNLTAGCYVVDVDETTVPQGHVLTTPDEQHPVSLGVAENYVDADFGYVTLSSIGDTVWLDSDADGVYDSETGELGVNGVLVELIEDGSVVDFTITGDSPYTNLPGFYLFDSLPPGDYTVRVAAGNFDPGNPLSGYEQTYDLNGGLDNQADVGLGSGVDFLDADFGYRPSCGNGVCQGGIGESTETCAADCPAVCGDGSCNGGEACGTCPFDCGECPPPPPSCGDGACNGAEDWSSCAADCPPVCGDGACNGDESCSSCSFDCGECAPTCGDGSCNGDENSASCPDDCPTVCGDYVCEAGETCSTCVSDCGTCPAVCGDGTCSFEETCSTCSSDCGECAPVCGDGTCNGNEDCSSCSPDCGACPVTSPGTGTQGYWKNHPSAWPVEQLTIGGVVYSKAQLIKMMKHPTNKDMTYALVQQLIAAMLNVGIGNQSSCIEASIAAANTWFAAHPVGSNVKGSSTAWTGSGNGNLLNNTLDSYNNGLMCAPHRD